MVSFGSFLGGNTSTNVEKTLRMLLRSSRIRKHLHERGENAIQFMPFVSNLETPPRTWRKLFASNAPFSNLGNTSTNVEKTSSHNAFRLHREKHLHERGENSVQSSYSEYGGETPPRTWRNLSSM